MRTAPALALGLCALLASSCAKAPPEPELVPADHASWRKTTDIVLDYPIPGHEDRLRVIRMNATGFSVRPVAAGSGQRWDFPAGTVIAKDIYATATPPPGAAPVQVTAMVKAPGDPRAQGGWIWVVKDAATGGETVMKGNFCVGCHANANEGFPYGDRNPDEEFRDYVFFVPGAAPPPPPPSGNP